MEGGEKCRTGGRKKIKRRTQKKSDPVEGKRQRQHVLNLFLMPAWSTNLRRRGRRWSRLEGGGIKEGINRGRRGGEDGYNEWQCKREKKAGRDGEVKGNGGCEKEEMRG